MIPATEAVVPWWCERCGANKRPRVIHWRVKAEDGGDARPSNLYRLCDRCAQWVEDNPTLAERHGWVSYDPDDITDLGCGWCGRKPTGCLVCRTYVWYWWREATEDDEAGVECSHEQANSHCQGNRSERDAD